MATPIQLPAVGSMGPGVEILDDDDLDDAGDYEDQLIGLMARLEHLREGLVAAIAARRAGQALTRCVELMTLVSEFANRHFPFAGPEMRDALARAGEFQGALSALREPGKGPADDPARLTLTRRCFTAMNEAALAYFVAFTSRFPTSRAARGWVEVAATFSADLKRTVRDVAPSA
jgi:hypothetical protein